MAGFSHQIGGTFQHDSGEALMESAFSLLREMSRCWNKVRGEVKELHQRVRALEVESRRKSLARPPSSARCETYGAHHADLCFSVTVPAGQEVILWRQKIDPANAVLPSAGRDHIVAPRVGPCYYHTNFGPAARKCQKPCSYGMQ